MDLGLVMGLVHPHDKAITFKTESIPSAYGAHFQAVVNLARKIWSRQICSTPLTVLPYITGRKTPGRCFSWLMVILDCKSSQPLPKIKPGVEKAES